MDLKASYENNVSATLSYNYNKAVGPTPFNFDYITPLTNSVSGKLTLKPTEKVKLDLSSNYNFVTENFGNLVAKLEYKPKDDWKMNFSSSYNLNTKEWTKKVNSTLVLQRTVMFIELFVCQPPLIECLRLIRGEVNGMGVVSNGTAVFSQLLVCHAPF